MGVLGLFWVCFGCGLGVLGCFVLFFAILLEYVGVGVYFGCLGFMVILSSVILYLLEVLFAY